MPVSEPPAFEFGVDTFGDVTLDAAGTPRPHAQVLRDVIEEAVIAADATRSLELIGTRVAPRVRAALVAPGTPHEARGTRREAP